MTKKEVHFARTFLDYMIKNGIMSKQQKSDQSK